MAMLAVKGTHDIIGEEASAYAYIENVFKAAAEIFGYKGIETPIMEYTDVFLRSTGESSDVVRKEMYTFLDKGDRSVTLRPEHTAGVARAIVEKKLLATSDMPLKLFYVGPAFRYERPQLGRYRQFIQAGVEAVGMDSPYLDAETITLAMRVLNYLGFRDLKVKVNTLGDAISRENYKKALKEYYYPHLDEMCDDCKKRYELNPLRMLDCKVESDKKLVDGAPKMKDYLTDEARQRFVDTLAILSEDEVDFEVDETLVRGLDYYGHIVFEIHAISPSGADYGALLGGGHYDNMLSQFGEKGVCDSGVGFAFGVERLYSLMKDCGLFDELEQGIDVYMMPLDEKYISHSYHLASRLRALGYAVETPYAKAKLGTLFKRANRKNARIALIFGETEIENNKIQVKDLRSETQYEVDLEELDNCLSDLLSPKESECCEGENCECEGENENGEGHCCHRHSHDEEGEGE